MATGKDVKAGGAFVELFTKDGKLIDGLNRAQARLKAFGAGVTSLGKKMSALGIAIVAPLFAITRATVTAQAALYDMSQRTGLSVEALSRLGYAAEQTGTDLSAVEGAIRKMQAAIAGVKDDIDGTTGSLAALGITAQELDGKLPEEQFRIVAARIASIKDPTERAAAAMKVFGKTGTQLLPLIQNMEELRKRQERLGIVETTGTAMAMDELDDLMTDALLVIKSIWREIAKSLLPHLKSTADWMIRLATRIREWVKENRGLITTIFKIGTALTIAGAAAIAFGKAIDVLAPILKYTGVLLGVMVETVAFLLSPIGLLSVALVGLAGYFLFMTETGGKALKWLGERFKNVVKDAQDAIGGISDALAAGDIKLAAQILWAFLKLEWERGKATLTEIWQTITNFFQTAWIDLCADMQLAWSYFVQYFNTAWEGSKMAAQKFLNWLGNAFESTVNYVADLIQDLFMANQESALKDALASIDQAETSGKLSKDQAARARVAAHRTFDDYDTKQRNTRNEQQRKDYDAQQRELDEQFKRATDPVDAAEKRARAQIEAMRTAAKAAVGAGDKAAQEAAQAEIDKLQKELEALRAKAKAAREKANEPGPEDVPPPAPGREGMEDVEALKSRGTFNARAILGLQTSTDIDQQQLNEQKKINKQLRRMSLQNQGFI